jgi:hypothetical protein
MKKLNENAIIGGGNVPKGALKGGFRPQLLTKKVIFQQKSKFLHHSVGAYLN